MVLDLPLFILTGYFTQPRITSECTCHLSSAITLIDVIEDIF